MFEGLDNHKIKLFNGILPKTIAFGILETEAYDSSYTTSSCNFKPGLLKSFDIKYNGKPIVHFPLNRQGVANYSEFYKHFLKVK